MSQRHARRIPAFFEPMMAALRLIDPDPQPLTLLSEGDWRELLEFSDLAHLTLPLVLQYKSSVPAWVVARVEQNLADNRIRNRRIAEAYAEMAQALKQAGIEHVVIKGFAQCPDFVSAWDRRMQSDIDLYCPRPSISAAQKTLESLGYVGDRTLEKFPADHVPAMSRPRGWEWRGNPYDPEMPPGVDLHFCLWNQAATRMDVEGTEAFWGRREQHAVADFRFPALSTMDSLAFNALHILRDLLRGDWVVHHVYEIACFLHGRGDDASVWQTWEQSHDPSLRSLQAISFFLARRWFHCRCSPLVEHEIEQLPAPVKHWLNSFSQSPLTGMFHPNKDGVWLHLALLPSVRDKMPVFVNALFPLRVPRVGAPGQGITKTRRQRRFWPSQPHVRYLLHVIFRAAFHIRMLPDTLSSGFTWWCSRL